MKLNNDWLLTNGKYKCPFCDKEFTKNGIMSHVIFLHTTEGKERMINRVKNVDHSKKIGKPTWIKGLTKKTDDRVKQMGKKISEVQLGKPGHPQTQKTKDKLSKIAKINELGGHTSKKQIFYKTIEGNVVYLQSSYEIKVANELDNNGIKWTRPKFIEWIDDNKLSHRYYPDFYLCDFDIYLDPKNYFLQKKDRLKIELVQKQNNVKIIILSENELSWDKIKNKMQM